MRHFFNATNELTARKRSILGTAITLALAASSGQAAPYLIMEFMAGPDNSTENTGVRAQMTFSFTNDAAGDLVSIEIANTTPPEIGSTLTAVALEWPFQIANPIFADGGEGSYFHHLNYNVNVNPKWINAVDGYDVVLTSDGRFQGGRPHGAPRVGESDIVTFNVGQTGLTADELYDTFYNFYTTASLPLAAARFQEVGVGGHLSDMVIMDVHVPEPSSLLLVGLGGWLVTRRRS
jgi:hypothetical protein